MGYFMEIHDPAMMVSASLQAVVDYLASYNTHRSIICMSGGHGSGKTCLAQRLHQRAPGRVVTLGWSDKNRYRAQWIILADNAQQNNCRYNSYPRNQFCPAFVKDLNPAPEQPLTLIVENAHWCGCEIVKDIELLQQYLNGVRLILLGSRDRKLRKELRHLPTEFITLAEPTWQEARDYLIRQSNISSSETVFTKPFVQRLLRLSRGDVGQLNYAAAATALLLQAEQTPTLNREQQRVIYRSLGDKRGYRYCLGSLFCAALAAVAIGWGLPSFLSTSLPPLPPLLQPAPPTEKSSATTDITRVVASDRDALSLLFATWGYDVPPDEAWCDRAQQAELLCRTGKSSLQALAAQGVPWIASLYTGQKTIPAVVVHVSADSLDVLIGQQTWTLKREWFEAAWRGDYLLLWKPSPLGETSITRDSDEEDILWLETTLNRVLNLTSSPTGEWSPVLTEKVMLFQKQNQLAKDGLVGSSTLIRLWQAAGEGARLFNDDDTRS